MELVLAEELRSETPRPTSRDSIDAWRDELDGYYKRMQCFPDLDPSEIFQELAAFSGRASEIRAYCVRIGTRAATSFRTQEIDYLLTEVDRQFRSWSRVVTVRGQEISLAGGL